MTVQSGTNRNNYVGNGATNTYSYTFRIQKNTHLRVTVRNLSGVETTLALTTHYTVTGVGNASGGTIVLVNGAFDWIQGGNLKNGYALTIRRELPLLQETDIRNQGDFFPEIHEDVFDRLVMIDQQQKDELSRSIRLPETLADSFNPTLPGTAAAAANRASRALVFNDAGDGMALGPTATEISNAQTHATAAAASATAAANSATSASNSATAASNSATAAANSASAAAAAAASNVFHDVIYVTNAMSPFAVTTAHRGKLLVADTTAGPVVFNLPQISSLTIPPGHPIGFLKMPGTSDTNPVTINRAGTDVIGGATSKVIRSAGAGCVLVPDVDASPDEWSVLDQSPFVLVQDTLANLQALPRVEGRVYYATDADKLYLDNGTALSAVGAGSGSINYCTNPDAEASASGWVTYANTAGPAPVTGAGGSPNITWTRTTSSPLEGLGSFLLTKDAANRQGQGVAFDFTIAPADLGKQLTVSFVSQSSSGYVANDVLVYVIADPSGTPQVIQLTPAGIPKADSTGGALYTGTFQAGPTATSYRLCFHVATTSNSAYTLKIDRVSIAPSPVAFAAAVTDPVAYTPTLNSNTGVAANNARWWRAGRYMMIEGAVRYSGTGAASVFTVSLPSGYSIDDTVAFDGNDSLSQILGFWGWYDDSGSAASRGGYARRNSATSVSFVRNDTSNAVDSSAFANNDRVTYQLRIPIAGWGSNVQIGSYDGRTVAARYTSSTTALSASYTTVVFPTRDYDTHNAYNPSTGVFTAPVAGYYRATTAMRTASAAWAANNGFFFNWRKNGTSIKQNFNYAATTATFQLGAQGACEVFLNAGDTLDLRAVTSVSVSASGDATENVFEISLVPGRSTLAAGDYVPPKVTRYTSGSGTHNVAETTKYLRVRMLGAGGGGGGNSTTSGAAAGGAGGDTTFGTAVAKGGTGGRAANPSAAPSGTDAPDYVVVNIYRSDMGQSGGRNANTANSMAMPGGKGGSSFLGGGGQGNGGGAGQPALANTGGGGGGGSSANTANDWAGSGGNSGEGIEFIIYNPLPSYSYTVGAGGSPGSGTNHNGGPGGSGVLIVEEYSR